ncbi:O-linked N-acetylglucosamine transferase, SPINDLY family protein [Thiocapsa roseopersicina]|uniref:protein O-GlcNAc transferase n=1 Tax=Thiocapsa roseopersicina TaxID=1058 RepID=A0A1H2V2G9_THIRO|nr:tetratricopeptide repeat protein [Thiocapsa roseopersicina]SDW62480.1 Predicted O-linked N-acetylglucosamine transferase, SPINDLY family [Thiocapsa roseopersicina]
MTHNRISPTQPSRPSAPHAVKPASRLQRGIAAFQAGHHAEARRVMQKVLERDPAAPDALHILGLLAAQAGRMDEAESLLRRCIAAAPDYVDAHNNLGNVLMARGHPAQARDCYAQAARLAPRYPSPHYNLGNALRALGNLDEAEAAYRTAIALAPGYVDAHVNLGNLLREREDYAQAESVCRDLLARHPELHEVRLNLGNIHRLCHRLQDAGAEYEALLSARPGHPRGLLSLALLRLAEHRPEQAETLIEQARASGAVPAHELLSAVCALRLAQGDWPAALVAATQSLAAGGETPGHAFTIAELLAEMGRRGEAVEVLQASRSRFGDRPRALLGALISNRRYLCDWRDWETQVSTLSERIRSGDGSVIGPFSALAQPGLTPTDLLAVARAHGTRFRAWTERRGAVSGAARPAPRERLRIGYLSSDLRRHAVASLTASLFEDHDRDRFEISAYAIGPADDSPIRRRLLSAFEHFTELRDLSHEAAAQRIRDDGIDILVDLNGYTRHARPEILAQRPAPIQVSWLGFPGSMGVPFIDYLIADPIVAPPESADAYDEALAYLPDSYQPVDMRRPVGPTPTRAEAGLPEKGLVFCCFNNPYKLAPEVFDGWCTLLKELPDAVLWLYAPDEPVRLNLLREAAERGLPAERLVFAPKCPEHADHLARVALADLFLDTQPYNAHTTASDALSVGVPVLTYPGRTFPSRVAASLLTAAGLPELIATDARDYLDRARRLAGAPHALADIRRRLLDARATAPLFDSERFARALEDLYRQMWARRCEGLPPAQLRGSPTGPTP